MGRGQRRKGGSSGLNEVSHAAHSALKVSRFLPSRTWERPRWADFFGWIPLAGPDTSTGTLKTHFTFNLGGIFQDSIDSLDLADNAILSLSNLPRLTRLVTLNLANNPITSISPNIAHQLPNLRSLVLTGTQVSPPFFFSSNQFYIVLIIVSPALSKIAQLKDLASLTPLFSLHKLEFLSLASTPLAQLPHYRSWVAHNLPSLRWLDFSKVKGKEREHATSLFVKSDGAPSDLAVSMGASSAAAAGMMMKGEINGGQVPAKTFEAGGGKAGKVGMGRGLTDEQKARVRKAIEKAGTLEEIQRLKRMLTDGFIPDEKTIKALGAK